jgi:transcriptional regulator with XRE-family HTH domain
MAEPSFPIRPPTLPVLTRFARALLKERLKTESQLSLARRAGVSDTSLGDVAAGKRGLGLNVLLGLLKAFDVSLSKLDRALQRWRQGTRPASKCLDD